MIYQIIGITRCIQQKLLCCLLDYLVYLFVQQSQALTQQSIQTIKYRNLVIAAILQVSFVPSLRRKLVVSSLNGEVSNPDGSKCGFNCFMTD